MIYSKAFAPLKPNTLNSGREHVKNTVNHFFLKLNSLIYYQEFISFEQLIRQNWKNRVEKSPFIYLPKNVFCFLFVLTCIRGK